MEHLPQEDRLVRKDSVEGFGSMQLMLLAQAELFRILANQDEKIVLAPQLHSVYESVDGASYCK